LTDSGFVASRRDSSSSPPFPAQFIGSNRPNDWLGVLRSLYSLVWVLTECRIVTVCAFHVTGIRQPGPGVRACLSTKPGLSGAQISRTEEVAPDLFIKSYGVQNTTGRGQESEVNNVSEWSTMWEGRMQGVANIHLESSGPNSQQ